MEQLNQATTNVHVNKRYRYPQQPAAAPMATSGVGGYQQQPYGSSGGYAGGGGGYPGQQQQQQPMPVPYANQSAQTYPQQMYNAAPGMPAQVAGGYQPYGGGGAYPEASGYPGQPQQQQQPMPYATQAGPGYPQSQQMYNASMPQGYPQPYGPR